MECRVISTASNVTIFHNSTYKAGFLMVVLPQEHSTKPMRKPFSSGSFPKQGDPMMGTHKP